MNTPTIQSTVYRVLQSIFIFGLIICTAISCDDVNINGPQNGNAHMNVHLTDAPGDYEEVNVEIRGLRVHFTPTGGDTASADTSGNGKFIDLPVDSMVVNLLDLTNGADTLLSSTDLEPGIYKELRLILGDNNMVVVDGTTHDLKVPSGQQSGYKIKFQTELEAGEEIDVTIDFDAEESVHQAGNKYILKPVLKAFVQTE